MKLKHFSLIFSVLGISLLYLLSMLSNPTAIELYEISEYDGKQIIAEGIVTDYHTTTYNSQIITIENNNTSAIVFVEGEIFVEYGDLIEATGTVQKYKGEWEIVVDDTRFIKILRKWNNISFPLWQLAENPERYEGLNVNATGFIDLVYDTYFYLIDEDDIHSILVFYTPVEQNFLIPGKKVKVAAKFYFDEEDLRYKLVINEENHRITFLSDEG
jgi:hypothetical protein